MGALDPASLTRREVFEAVPLIEDAITASGDEATPDAVVAMIFAGQAQLWRGDGSALVTEITEDSTGRRTVHAWLASGVLEEIGRLALVVEAYGRSLGCSRATVNGRPGWARFHRSRGYVPTRILLEKAL